MFSGIIQEIGKMTESGNGRLVISCSSVASRVADGSSVCVSGVCLTVAGSEGETLMFDVMQETLRKTTLGEKKAGDRVNLEPALRAGDELGGHFVYGHADGVGEVTNVEKENDAALVTIRLPRELMRYLAPQGSVAVDGVSLTVARLGDDTITVSLVPYTLEQTTLGRIQSGERVNIECDMLAKLVIENQESRIKNQESRIKN